MPSSARPALPPTDPPSAAGVAPTKQCPEGQAGCVGVRESHHGAEDVRCTVPKGQEGDTMGEHVKGGSVQRPQPAQAFPGPGAATPVAQPHPSFPLLPPGAQDLEERILPHCEIA